MARFPSLKARALRQLLVTSLGYRVARQRGSHQKLTHRSYPPLIFAFHDGQELPPGIVRKILVKDVGLSEPDALLLLRMR